MGHNQSNIVAIFLTRSIGSILFDLASEKRAHLNITIEPVEFIDGETNLNDSWYSTPSATIFIIVFISVLICLCFAWFLFYYCQRYRSRTAKDRLNARLNNAAKKALAKIKLINVTDSSNYDESCVICLDSIKTGDTVRQLGNQTKSTHEH
jgi:Zn-dependent protease with chaperone function